MKKFVPYALAAVAITLMGTNAQADRGRGRPTGSLMYAAQQVEQDAYGLVQILARGGPANTQLIQNGGMVAKEAHDLVRAPNSEREFREVFRAFAILAQNFRWQGRPNAMAQDAFRRLEYSVQDLEFSRDGGSRDGRDGRGGRDGQDDGFEGPQNDGGGDWGQNDDQQGDYDQQDNGQQDNGTDDGGWGHR